MLKFASFFMTNLHGKRLRRGDDVHDCDGDGEFGGKSGNLRAECTAAGEAAGCGTRAGKTVKRAKQKKL